MSKVPNQDWSQKEFENAAYDLEQRRVHSRRPKKAADLISRITARYGVGSRQANEQLQGVFDSAIGVELANHCRVIGLKRGVLEVQVASSSISMQLSFKKTEILKLMKDKLPKEKIRDLRFRMGPVK